MRVRRPFADSTNTQEALDKDPAVPDLARKPLADITNTQYRDPPWLRKPLTAAELKEDQKNREAKIEKQIQKREARNQARERTQDKMNQFGDALQQALLPGEDDAARHGNSAPPLGKANMGSGHELC